MPIAMNDDGPLVEEGAVVDAREGVERAQRNAVTIRVRA